MVKFLTTVLLLAASALAQCPSPTKVEALASAIARAEGFYVRGSLPNRLNNPGDIRLTPSQAFGRVPLDKHNYVVFKTKADGFAALHGLLDNISAGNSTVYRTDMTFNAFARRYVGGAGWGRWVKIVTKQLGISPSTTLEAYFNEDRMTS